MSTINDSIIEVYSSNFISEMKHLSSLLDDYPYIGMDTEFPGIVYGINSYTPEFYYKSIKTNVDSLKLIQLGITLSNAKGEYPPHVHTWQFNLKFDFTKDNYSEDSFKLLQSSGIDFHKLQHEGIAHSTFAEYLMVSGLVLNPDVYWICFHGSYDFAYLLSLLINTALPETEDEFTQELITYFPSHFDIRILVKGNDYLHGGLNKIANTLDVFRVGKTHQAGSDSVVTLDVFFKLIKNATIDKNVLEDNMNVIYGIGSGADDQETIQYTKFSNDGVFDYMNHIANANALGLGMNVGQQNLQGIHYANVFTNNTQSDYYTQSQHQHQHQQRFYQGSVVNGNGTGSNMVSASKYAQRGMNVNGVGNGKKDFSKVIVN